MIAFRVQVNRDEAVTGGLSGLHAMSIVAGSAMRDRRYQAADEPPIDLRLHIGGLRRSAEGIQAHVLWLERQLEAGDVITISVVDVPESDISRPTKETTMAELTEKGERAELARLMKKYGAT